MDGSVWCGLQILSVSSSVAEIGFLFAASDSKLFLLLGCYCYVRFSGRFGFGFALIGI